MFKKLLGSVAILFGITIIGWVGFNLFVEKQDAAKGRRKPIVPILFSCAMIYTGTKWMKGDQGSEANDQ